LEWNSDIEKAGHVGGPAFFLETLFLDDSLENLVQALSFFVVYRNYKATPTFERNSKND
jgi:hypothetical protein